MIQVPITLRENNNTERTSEPTRVSIPFASGFLFNPDELHLVNCEDASLPFQSTILTRWPDKSVKWLQINFQTDMRKNQQETLWLKASANIKAKHTYAEYGVSCSEEKKEWVINTGNSEFTLNKHIFNIQSSDSKDALTSSLVIGENKTLSPIITQISQSETSPHNLEALFTIKGHFAAAKSNELSHSPTHFSAYVTFYAHKSYIKCQFTIHNTNKIQHDGGTWDLGNENSLYFKTLTLDIAQNEINNLTYSIQKNDFPKTLTEKANIDLSITQLSSGGDNWQSNNHMNHDGKVTLPFKGYTINTDQSLDVIDGRAQPWLYTNKVAVYITNFWQNFPTSLSVKNNTTTLGLFPNLNSELHELQPGEKKSHICYIDFNAQESSANIIRTQAESPLDVSIDREYIASTQVLPLFSTQDNESALNRIIELGLTSENNFFQKREMIDEFGWRNFGDLFADHETLAYEGDSELISHYNNQYDPLYGFLRQYLLTKNTAWLTLANDLASHIKDIDIYHTEKDRDEYNGGLFWHTDHYLPAETASHRTYSKRQTANAYQDHAGGGGPGGQHCYTTGLMLHYFITGDSTSKEAALTITQWITNVYEGSSSLGDLLLAIKNKNRIDLKNIFTGKYPLDRGTANYIVALLDGFELSSQQSLLDNASLVIKNTVHPHDDITLRDLSNVEECWFYTVFLQAVGRFLQIKLSHEQLDESFHYARDVLIHYTNWMQHHEAPYLNKPDILEYPNHTWAAQDIRKANIFYVASVFATSEAQRQSFLIKGHSFYDYVTKTLWDEPTKDVTRILSLLMQNHGAKSYAEENTEKTSSLIPLGCNHYTKEEKSPRAHLLNAISNTLSNTSLTQELTWLRKRVAKVDKLLIKAGH